MVRKRRVDITKEQQADAMQKAHDLGMLPIEALQAAGVPSSNIKLWAMQYMTDPDVQHLFDDLFHQTALYIAEERAEIGRIRRDPGRAVHAQLDDAHRREKQLNGIEQEMRIELTQLVGATQTDDTSVSISLLPTRRAKDG